MPRGGIRPICSVANCGRPHRSKGYCDTHYWRFRKHGDPLKLLPKEEKTCSVPECGEKHAARGYCKAHWRRMKRNGTLTLTRQKWPSTCTVENCSAATLARGLCSLHYYRWLDHGDPNYTPAKTGMDLIRDDVLPYKGDDCFIWPMHVGSTGYGRVHHAGKLKSAHRVVCELYHGPAPSPHHEVAHLCGNPPCVAPLHLAWKTKPENMDDKNRHGTVYRGNKHHSAKLTESQVLEIRSLNGLAKPRDIAERYSVSRILVSQILRGKKWAWLDQDCNRS